MLDLVQFGGFKWVKVGQVNLSAGKTELEMFTSGNPVYIDCAAIVPEGLIENETSKVVASLNSSPKETLYLLEFSNYFKLTGTATRAATVPYYTSDSQSGYVMLGQDGEATATVYIAREGNYTFQIRSNSYTFDLLVDGQGLSTPEIINTSFLDWLWIRSSSVHLTQGYHNVSVVPSPSIAINNCNSTQGWDLWGGIGTYSINTMGLPPNSAASIELNSTTKVGDSLADQYIFPTPISLYRNGSISFWIEGSPAKQDDQMAFYVIDADGNWLKWLFDVPAVWTKITLSLDSPTGRSQNQINLTKIKILSWDFKSVFSNPWIIRRSNITNDPPRLALDEMVINTENCSLQESTMNVPQPSYIEVNLQEWEGSVNLDHPAYLVLTENIFPQWMLQLSGNKSSETLQPYPAFYLLNSFYISQTGMIPFKISYELPLIYRVGSLAVEAAFVTWGLVLVIGFLPIAKRIRLGLKKRIFHQPQF
jgi:hypothetical protein